MKSEFGEFVQKQSSHFRFLCVLEIIQPLGSSYVAACYILHYFKMTHDYLEHELLLQI